MPPRAPAAERQTERPCPDPKHDPPGESMLKPLMTVALLAAFAAAPAYAADSKMAPEKPMNPQQERMKSCNAKAGDKKGDDRKAFMKTCLSDEKKSYDSKMGQCNTQSKGMKGDERKKFMSDCMKKAA
jgi:hypothetical protein